MSAMMSARKAARLEALGWDTDYDVAARPQPIPYDDIFPIDDRLSYLLVSVRDHEAQQQAIESVIGLRR